MPQCPTMLFKMFLCLAMLAIFAAPAFCQDSLITIGANAELTCSGGADACGSQLVVDPDGLFNGSWCGEPLAIDLAYFTAAPGPMVILLEWGTASELGTAGFNLWRQDAESGKTLRVNKSMIPGAGGIAWGSDYQVVDRWVIPGRSYTYWLEEVENSGLAALYGPVVSRSGMAGAPHGFAATEPDVP